MLDSPILSRAAGYIPGIRGLAVPMLEGVKGYARNAKANTLANLLADSGTAANSLEQLVNSMKKKEANSLRDLIEQASYRTLPVAASR